MTRRQPSWQWVVGYRVGYAVGKLSVLIPRWRRRREVRREVAQDRRPYVTPGHPAWETHGYDCLCLDCWYGRYIRSQR